MTIRFASIEFSISSSRNRKCRFVFSFIANNSDSVIFDSKIIKLVNYSH